MTSTVAVVRSPACAMPQYAGYQTRFWLVTGGSHLLTRADTLTEITETAPGWADFRTGKARIVEAPVNHEGRAVGRAKWPGGTWQGRCGSMIWLTDPDLHYRDMFATLNALGGSHWYMQDSPIANDIIRITQARWMNGTAARTPACDGFFVECQQQRQHLGNCTALDVAWDPQEYAPCSHFGMRQFLF